MAHYRDTKTGRFASAATWRRSKARGGTRYKRERARLPARPGRAGERPVRERPRPAPAPARPEPELMLPPERREDYFRGDGTDAEGAEETEY